MDNSIIAMARRVAARRGHDVGPFGPVVTDMAVQAVCARCDCTIFAAQDGTIAIPRHCRPHAHRPDRPVPTAGHPVRCRECRLVMQTDEPTGDPT